MSQLQATASKSDLFLNCQRPFDPAVSIEKEPPTGPMRYGSGFHEACASLAIGVVPDLAALNKKWEVEISVAHLHAAWHVLETWLAKEKLRIVGVEKSRATMLRGASLGKSRDCDFDVEAHHYELRDGEMGGTYDLLLAGPKKRRVVLDIKTGDWGTFHSPAQLGQMRTLAMQTGATEVAILHTPRESVPVVYHEAIAAKDVRNHTVALANAFARIGDGSLRPGPWCDRCPARTGCPAKQGEVLLNAGALVRAANVSLGKPVDEGALHLFLQEFDRLAKMARDQIKAKVKGGALVTRPDGRVLTLRIASFENLSKASIVRALGKQKGEAMIEKLRKLGAIEKSERESLYAVGEG